MPQDFDDQGFLRAEEGGREREWDFILMSQRANSM
jgi:hypothetical protein